LSCHLLTFLLAAPAINYLQKISSDINNLTIEQRFIVVMGIM